MLNYYEQINSNKRQSFGIIALFIGFIIATVYFIAQATNNPELVPIAIIFSTGSSLISYFAGDKIVLGLNNARPAARKEFFDFYTVTENLSMAAKIPVPKIYVIEADAMNAFATGRDPDHAIICATTGLLSKLNRSELEGVVGHELSHIKNYDIRLMTIVSILIGTLSILINMSYHSRSSNNDDNKSNGIFMIIGLLLIIFAPIIAQLIQLAISRRREYFADASAVAITHQPSGLISALKKLSQDNSPSDFASTATASLYISNPFKGNKLASMFSTHPPIEDRIKTLEAML
ncbi:MAG: M48 family metallopeptidase [Candidatus Shapirobacteria bacterium]